MAQSFENVSRLFWIEQVKALRKFSRSCYKQEKEETKREMKVFLAT